MNTFELIFLGTGAADWDKRPRNAVRYDTEGRIRRFSSMLVNRSYLIDPSPESWFFAKNVLKLDLSGIKGIFLTHSHADHFSQRALKSFQKETGKEIDFYCHENTLECLKLTENVRSRLKIHPLKTDKKIKIGGLSVLPLEANHEVTRTGETVLHYVFAIKDKSFFYGCDGGWFLAGTWRMMQKLKLDLVILEATVGNQKANYRIGSHNTLPMIELLVASMEACGMIKEGGRVVLSHMSEKEHGPGEEYGRMTAAFDGMKFAL